MSQPILSKASKSGERSRGTVFPPDLFDQVTDILADLVLEDLKQYPRIPTGLRIDRFSGRENTLLPTQTGGE